MKSKVRKSKQIEQSRPLAIAAIVVSGFAILVSAYSIWNISVISRVQTQEAEGMALLNKRSAENRRALDRLYECHSKGTDCSTSLNLRYR